MLDKEKKIKFFSKSKESSMALIYDCFFLLLIALSLVTLLSSYEVIDSTINYNNKVTQWIYDNDVIFLSIFAFDFFARWIVNIINGFYQGNKKGAISIIRFPFSAEGLIGILAILPYFLMLPIWNSLRLLKFFTLTDLILRLKRVKYIGEIINGFSFMIFSIKLQGKMIMTLTIILIITVSFLSVIVYNVALVNPDVFGGSGGSPQKIQTFFDAFWFTFVTMTTIGYGDIYPVEASGRILVIIISITGIIFVAIYTSLIINGLQIAFRKKAELDKNNKIIREENRKLAKIESRKRKEFIKRLFIKKEIKQTAKKLDKELKANISEIKTDAENEKITTTEAKIEIIAIKDSYKKEKAEKITEKKETIIEKIKKEKEILESKEHQAANKIEKAKLKITEIEEKEKAKIHK